MLVSWETKVVRPSSAERPEQPRIAFAALTQEMT